MNYKLSGKMAPLRKNLKEAIATEARQYRFKQIAKARSILTERYHDGHYRIDNDAQRCAYLVSRLPATFGVISRVLQEVRNRSSGIKSLLDLGCGPGSVMWAACELFPEIEKITMIEKDRELIELGKRLLSFGTHPAMQSAQWWLHNLERQKIFPSHDLVVMSYSVGELSLSAIPALVKQSWKAAGQFLVIIEPGTPKGFERLREIRDQLISLGAHIVAPCPHANTCPMSKNDWCHFSQRIERSSLHRKIKEADLGYEDEKYSYLIFSKNPYPLPRARLLRHPIKRSGHVLLTLCEKSAYKQKIISRRSESYTEARSAQWGSSLDYSDEEPESSPQEKDTLLSE